MGSIHKGLFSEHYTKISNKLIRDREVTDSAYRLISWILSHSDGFSVSFAGITKALGYKREKIRNAIKNAEERDYLVRIQIHNPKTGAFDWDYYVFPTPEETIAFRLTHNIPKPGVSHPPTADPTTGEPSSGSPTPHKKNNKKKINKKKIKEEEDAPAAKTTDVVEAEIVEEENQLTDTGFVESEDETYSVNAITTRQETFTPPRNVTVRVEKLREIEKLSSKPQEFPWKEDDGVTFREEMVDAVWQGNREWYSVESGARNDHKIKAHLKSLERKLKKPNDEAIASWDELQGYWKMAVSSLPEVQQVKEAFNEKDRETARAKRRNSNIRFTS